MCGTPKLVTAACPFQEQVSCGLAVSQTRALHVLTFTVGAGVRDLLMISSVFARKGSEAWRDWGSGAQDLCMLLIVTTGNVSLIFHESWQSSLQATGGSNKEP